MTTSTFSVGKAPSGGQSDVRWFAGLAMQAIIARHTSIPDTDGEREEIALWAYRMGQAMMQAEERLGVTHRSLKRQP